MLKLRPVWGIDIGDSSLKAVKLKRVGKQIVLQDFCVINYAEVGGEAGARREDALPQALAALQAAGLGRDPCIVSIAPQAIFSRFISLPPVDKRRVPEIVLYEARQQIPFNLNEVIWAYQTVRKELIPGEEIEIGLFAVKRDVIDAYLAELALVGRQLHGVQVAPLALYNFVRHDVDLEKPTVIMDIGAQSTDLLIVDGDKFWLRNLPIAGNSFTAILEKRLNIPRAEAEKLKLSVPESRYRRKLLEVLRPVMRDLVGEIQRSIGYYKSLSHDVKFEEILVAGEGYRLFGLDRFLAERLQYKVTPIHQLRNVLFQAEPERVKELGNILPSLGVAFGLALQGLGASQVTVDLLPDDFVIDRELHHKRFSGLIAAGLVCAIVGCFHIKEHAALAGIEASQNQGKNTLAQVEKLEKEHQAAKREGKKPELEYFGAFGEHRLYDAMVIDALTQVIPRNIRIDQFVFNRSSSGGVDQSEMGMRSGRSLGIGTSPDRSPGIGGGDRPSSRGGLGTGMGVGDRGSSGRGMESVAQSGPSKAVSSATFTVSFNAWCPAELEPRGLTEFFVAELQKAVLFPERVALIKNSKEGKVDGVYVSPPQPVQGSGADLDGREAKDELRSEIVVALKDASQAEADRLEMRKKAAEEAKRKVEEAAKAKADAEAAAKAAEAEESPENEVVE